MAKKEEKALEEKARARSPFPKRAIDSSKRDFPTTTEFPGAERSLTFWLASVDEAIPPWGSIGVDRRDQLLRDFWPTENFLAGAIFSTAARNSAFEWEIDGPPKTQRAAEYILHTAIANQGRGWIPFMESVTIDLATQDNGAFIELIRDENSSSSPVIGIGHLDAARCVRTGRPEFPVIYEDRLGKLHKMAWYNVIPISDMPSPIEKMNGVGYCPVTRVLRAAQILKDLMIYKHEKVSGRFISAIHFVGGVAKSEIADITERDQEDADNQGLIRFMMPTIVASLDPEKPVSHVEIPLKSLPDNFNFDEELKWYITQLAIGFGEDYQTFAPLPGGNLGTSTQSEILHRKSRGKGPALFMQTIQNLFHYYGVFPRTIKFSFVAQDLAEEKERAEVGLTQASAAETRIRSEITMPLEERRIAVKSGVIDDEDLVGDAEYLKYIDDLREAEIGLSMSDNGNMPPRDRNRNRKKPNEEILGGDPERQRRI